MKILVTGTAGFIGMHLVKKLLSEGENVVGIDNINDYYDVNLKFARLEQTGISREAENYNISIQSSIYPDYRFIRMNLEDKEQVNKLFNIESFDLVVNLAAQAGVRHSIDNPEVYIQSNIIGFFNILEACRHYNVKRLIYASSSSVYGNNSKVPFSEDNNVDHPISLYAATKKSNELLAYTYSHLYGIQTVGLRFFTVYGPWGRPDMAYFKFVKKILCNEPIEVYNNGNLERDFTYIDDIIEGVMRIIESLDKLQNNRTSGSLFNNEVLHRIYNIGNSIPIPLLDFIEAIENTLGEKAKLIMVNMQMGDVHKTWADISCLKKDLGYKPDTVIEKGIKRFTDWYIEHYSIY
jgi:UDP-glucuronate 4-epimerase